METIKVNTSQHVAIDYPVAGLGERIAARLIDLGIFLLLYILFLILGFTLSHGLNGFIIVPMGILFGVSYVFYNLVCEIFMSGQCIGKRMMKIRVISLDGGQPTLGQYFIRWIFRLADFILTAQVGGLISIAVTENKQRIGDLVAGTTLIKTVPRTTFEHIAFRPVEDENYIPVFSQVHQLSDRDIELVHEVLAAFQKTAHFDLVHQMTGKIAGKLHVALPRYEDELDFLNTVIKDYNHVTSASL